MNGRLKDEVTIVTAAAQGIGRATAVALAREGAIVHALDLNGDALGSLADGSSNIHIHVVDVEEAGNVATALRSIGPVSILVNAVGWVHQGDLLACDWDSWQRSWNINVTSMYQMTRQVLPPMISRGRGCIINIASVVSSIKGVPNRLAYGTAKAAVIGFSKAVAADYVRHGIRCNVVCPGTVDSPSLRDRIAQSHDREVTRADMLARQPMGRFGAPEEVAAAVVYLATPEAAFMTGSVMTIDGGMTL